MMASGSVTVSYVDEVMADSPLTWWRLNTPVTNAGTFADASGGGHPATISAGSSDLAAQPGPQLVAGAGQSYAKTGASPGGAIASSMPTVSGSYSVEAWLQTTDAGSIREILAQDNGPRLYQLRLESGKPSFTNIRGTIVAVIGPTSIADGIRHHLVATVDSTTSTNNIKLYLDGSLIGTGSASSTGSINIAACLGCYAGPSSNPSQQFAGNLADLAVYNSALSAARVAAHWNAGK